MKKLINQKSVKEYTLSKAKQLRKGWDFTRVSKKFLDDLNIKVKLIINNAISKHPSKGKTIKYLQ